MDETTGEQPPTIDPAMEAAMRIDRVNTKGQIVGLGVAGLSSTVREPEIPDSEPMPFPGEANYTSTADRLRRKPLKDSQEDARWIRQKSRTRRGRR